MKYFNVNARGSVHSSVLTIADEVQRVKATMSSWGFTDKQISEFDASCKEKAMTTTLSYVDLIKTESKKLIESKVHKKTCRVCNVEQPASEFYKRNLPKDYKPLKPRTDGLMKICKTCHKKLSTEMFFRLREERRQTL